MTRETAPAPRRFRLTQSVWNGGLGARPDSFPTGPVSFLSVLPIAAPCCAVRLGFANCFNFDQSIAAASVCPSDTYGGALSGGGRIAPTDRGGTPTGSPIWFDCTGETDLNLSGSNRRLLLAANEANRDNSPAPYTIAWSDWSPCTSLPRADGGAWPLLFVCITIDSPGFVSTAGDYLAFNATHNRGRKIANGLRASTDGDFSDDPASATWGTHGNPPFGPWFVLQYLTTTPSIQIVMTGDSLTTSPLTDGISNAVWRAAADLSSPRLPIEVLNLGWGATTWRVYHPLLARNLAAIEPSIVIPQVISRNGMGGVAQMQQLLAMATLNAQAAAARYGAKLIWNIPGCEPSWDSVPEFTHGFNDMRDRLLAATGVPVIDAPSVIGDVAGGAPWNHLRDPVVSDDDTHPNGLAQELVVPLAREAFRAVIGPTGLSEQAGLPAVRIGPAASERR